MIRKELQFFRINTCTLLIWVSCLSLLCCIVCSLQPSDHLLGKGLPPDSLVCAVFLCFCHFPIWWPGSGLVLDCIDYFFILFIKATSRLAYWTVVIAF